MKETKKVRPQTTGFRSSTSTKQRRAPFQVADAVMLNLKTNSPSARVQETASNSLLSRYAQGFHQSGAALPPRL